jgi:Na+-translocating ferredoxin:NAD+ oxidoreductase RnfC subunit
VHFYRLRKRKTEEKIAPQKKEFKEKNQEREREEIEKVAGDGKVSLTCAEETMEGRSQTLPHRQTSTAAMEREREKQKTLKLSLCPNLLGFLWCRRLLAPRFETWAGDYVLGFSQIRECLLHKRKRNERNPNQVLRLGQVLAWVS